MEFASSAISRGPPFPPGFSLGRETCPIPFFNVIFAAPERNIPFSSTKNGCASFGSKRGPKKTEKHQPQKTANEAESGISSGSPLKFRRNRVGAWYSTRR